MRFNSMAVIGLLCAAIAFMMLGTSDTRSTRLTADEISQKKAELNNADRLAKELMQQINDKQSQSDSRMIELIEGLQASVTRVSDHVRESVPTREEVTRLVSTTKPQSDGDGCTCGEKLADLQKQIDDLKTKLTTLEASCSKTSSASTAAAVSSSYGTASPKAAVSSGGSTGSAVKSGGSTGSVRSQSYGSTGSSTVTYSQPVYSQPVVQYSEPVYSDPTVYSAPVVVTETVTSNCYTNPITGQTVCPQRAAAAATTSSPSLFQGLRRRFSN